MMKGNEACVSEPTQPGESWILPLNHSWGKRSLSIHPLYLQTLVTAIQ